MSSSKQILLDLMEELSGEFLSDSFTVRGRVWEMRLLNEEETAWSFSMLRSNNQLSVALSARLAQLAVGIRSVNGEKLSEMFKAEYSSLSEGELDELKDLPYDLVIAKLFYDYLKKLPPTFIGELYENWQKLEIRRAEAQKEIKNS